MKKNAGIVLVTGMIFLLIITMIVIYLLRTSILEEKMAANSIDRQRALQAADAVLREAENRIAAGGAPFDPFRSDGFPSAGSCLSGLCGKLSGTTTLWDAISWSNLANLKTSTTSFYKTSSSYYVIELIKAPEGTKGGECTTAKYRIVAKGAGSVGAEAMVQSYYENRPEDCPTVF